MKRLTLMAILAHPDDESFSGAGAMAMYGARGVRTCLACATRGEAGKPGDPPLCTPEELPAFREQELRAACAVLGIQALRFLGLRDQELLDHDRHDGVGRVVQAIRELRPDVCYTFHPDGASGHGDHVAISDWATAAFRAAGDPAAYPDRGPAWQPAKLYYTVPPTQLPGHQVDAAIWVPDHVETRMRALRCHATQVPGFRNYLQGMDPDYMRRWFHTDYFQLADSILPHRPFWTEQDLFEGLPGGGQPLRPPLDRAQYRAQRRRSPR